MTQSDKAAAFRALHKAGEPIVLYNIWDAAGAQALVKEGARAVATGSWSVAGAWGYADGQALPLDLLLTVAERIAASVSVPVSIDFEGGFAEAPADITVNVQKLWDTGSVGLNFEDQVVGGSNLYPIDQQSERVAAVRAVNSDIVINARTDLFLKSRDPDSHAALVDDAIERAQAYHQAGADSFFVPGVTDPDLLSRICADSPMPVNAMMIGIDNIAKVAATGVARISYGPRPYFEAQADLADRYKAAMLTAAL